MTQKRTDSDKNTLRTLRWELSKHESAVTRLKRSLHLASVEKKRVLYGKLAARHRRMTRLYENIQEVL